MLKKKALAGVLVPAMTAVAGAANAQSTPAQSTDEDDGYQVRTRVGPRIGLTFTNFNNISADGVSALTSMTLGFAAHVPLGADGLSVAPEVHYSILGAGYDNGYYSGYYGELQLRIGYLQIPVALRYDIDAGGIRPHVFAGPMFALKLHAEFRYADYNYYYGGGGQDVGDYVSTGDIGVVSGAGIDIPVGDEALSLQFRYYRGFAQVIDGSSATNDQLGILFGWMF